MPQLTIKQYQEAIEKNVLLKRQIECLEILYYQPNHSATANRLAELIHPSKPANIIAGGRIGKIGKAFSDYYKISPKDYYFSKDKNRLSYFTLVSEIYDGEKGWTMYPNLRKAIENLAIVKKDKVDIPVRMSTELLPFEEDRFFEEGKLARVFVDRFERNRAARIECIRHNGDRCVVCGFNFEGTYGEIAKGYIHVHHLTPLSEIKKTYKVDPKIDMVPICPNCHAVIHLSNPSMSISNLKSILKKNKRRSYK